MQENSVKNRDSLKIVLWKKGKLHDFLKINIIDLVSEFTGSTYRF